MNRVLASTAIGVLTYMLVTPAFADLKPEDQIEFRQAGYSFMAWNMIKIKAICKVNSTKIRLPMLPM
ncbi:hypothetical protein [Chromatium okenii]|uniref:hypothetical protein n=1 Tax=Chromatium okenii TaxID=61644 RepID=UPI001F5BDA6B|nr:hypothetical protein [Chromatium okenii]